MILPGAGGGGGDSYMSYGYNVRTKSPDIGVKFYDIRGSAFSAFRVSKSQCAKKIFCSNP